MELRGSGRYRGWDSMLSFLRQVEANFIEERVEALRRESEEVQHFALFSDASAVCAFWECV